MDAEQSLGTNGLGELASRVLRDWQQGLVVEAEPLETCECCGGLLGFENPAERKMAEQWTSWEDPARMASSNGEGHLGTGWPTAMWGNWADASSGSTGWAGPNRDEDL